MNALIGWLVIGVLVLGGGFIAQLDRPRWMRALMFTALVAAVFMRGLAALVLHVLE